MKAQTALNRVMKFAYKQNAKCENEEGSCKYRGPNKMKCFVGAMIPDKAYDEEMEGSDAHSLADDFPEIAKHLSITGFTGNQSGLFWQKLQRLHDNHCVGNWPELFADFAEDLNLKIQVQKQ